MFLFFDSRSFYVGNKFDPHDNRKIISKIGKLSEFTFILPIYLETAIAEPINLEDSIEYLSGLKSVGDYVILQKEDAKFSWLLKEPKLMDTYSKSVETSLYKRLDFHLVLRWQKVIGFSDTGLLWREINLDRLV